jgi:hypothetical protein
MTQSNLKSFVLPKIDAPPGKDWPNSGFYINTYQRTSDLMQTGDMGGFLETLPQCSLVPGRQGALDVVSIDTTRYANIGVIRTLVDKGLVDAQTLFVMENDSWRTRSMGHADELAFVSSAFTIKDVRRYRSETRAPARHGSGACARVLVRVHP